MGGMFDGWRAHLRLPDAQIPPDVEPLGGLPTATRAESQPATEHVRPPAVPLHIRAGLGIMQRILETLDSASGMPQDDPLVIINTSADLTVEALSEPIAQPSILRAVHVSLTGGVAGTVVVSLHHGGLPGGVKTIFAAVAGSSASAGDFLARIPAGATLGISVDGATPAAGTVALTAIVTRASETPINSWRGRQ